MSLLLLFAEPGAISACDSCGCHLPSELAPSDQTWNAGVFVQYTDFGTLRDEGRRIDNDDDQYLHSLTTQLIVGCRLDDAVSVSLFVPYISRSFSRPDGAQTERGTVAGLGDSVVLASLRLVHREAASSSCQVSALVGLKMPTGDPSQLRFEEQGGGDQDPAAATGGHDLALGAGAWDPQLGLSATLRQDRWFATLQGTYGYNTEGAYEYRFANEISASAALGYLLYRASPWRLTIQANADAESKGLDSVSGMKTDDTANHDVFLGIESSAWWQHSCSADLAIDLPVYEHNSSTQLVPTYRIRGALSWFF